MKTYLQEVCVLLVAGPDGTRKIVLLCVYVMCTMPC